MLNCSRCGADYSEQGLENGRCRQCGNVIRWSATAMPFAANPAPADPTPAAPPREHSPEVAPEVALSVAPEAARSSMPSPEPETLDAGERETATPPGIAETVVGTTITIRDDPNGAATAPSEEVQKLWATSVPGGHKVTSTIHTDVTEVAVSNRLLIPRRSVRRSDEDSHLRTDYELLEVIGKGGQGIVHAARQASIDRTVALKMIRRPEPPGNAAPGNAAPGNAAPVSESTESHNRNKFLSEAVVTGDLEHPNIVPVYDLGTTNDGSPFYVMKRIQGTPWSDAIHRTPLNENLNILMRTADAVALAHSRGVVHRDLKPENVMLGDFGEVLLTDWGIALCTEQFAKRSSVVVSQGLGGTPAYMAPEMATGPLAKIGPAADVYLLGAILYEIVSGHPPHDAATVMDCLRAAANNQIRPTTIQNELIDIARHAMATNPQARYESVKDFQAAITAYQSHSESVLLSDQAQRDLQQAKTSGEYKDYAAAAFGFQKAVELWPDNRAARSALITAGQEYAAAALAKGDFDLALSLLDPTIKRHASLRAKILAAQADREARHHRLQRLRYTAAALLLAIFGGGTFAFMRVSAAHRDAEVARGEALIAASNAEDQAEEAERQRVVADQAKDLATLREAEAKLATANAEAAAERALKAKQESDLARADADAALHRAEVASYDASISLAISSISNNAFEDAAAILTDQATDPKKSSLRHWEWGRLMYLCRGGDPQSAKGTAVETLATDSETMAIAVSPRQDRLAASTRRGSIHLWQRDPSQPGSDWQPLRSLPGTVAVNDVAFSSNGELLAAAEDEGDVLVYRLADLDQPPLRLAGHKRSALSVGFSPTAEPPLLVSSSADRTVKLWNVETGETIRTLVGHTAEVWSVEVSHQGDRLVTASDDFTARVWSVETGQELQRFRQHNEPVFCATFSPDGKFVASGGYDKRILIWKADRFEPVESRLVNEVIRRLEADADSVIGDPFRALEGHSGGIRDVCFSADGRLIVSAARDNTLRLWDADPQREASGAALKQLRQEASDANATGGLLKILRGHGGWVTACGFLASGEIVSSGYDQKVKVWQPLRYEELKRMESIERPILAGRFSPDGDRVVLALDDGTAGIWNTTTGTHEGELEEGHDFLATTAAFLPRGDRLATVAGDDTARLWDVQHGTEIWAISGTGRRGLLALSNTGETMVTGSSDGKIAQLWDVETGKRIRTFGVDTLETLAQQFPQADRRELEKQIPDVTAISYSPDGNWIASGDSFGAVRLWKADQAEAVRAFGGHDLAITSLQWMPGGGVLLTASADSSIAFWDVQSGQELPGKRLLHDDAVSLLTVSPDGARALSVAADGAGGQRLHYWDLPNRRLLARHPTPGAAQSSRLSPSQVAINSIAFSPDQKMALVATFEMQTSRYQIRQWDLTSGEFGPVNERDLQAGMVFSAVYAQATAQQILTVGGDGARFWDEQQGRELMNYRPHGSILSIDYAPSGERIVTTGSDRSIKVWRRDTESGEWMSEEKLIGQHVGAINTAKFRPVGEDSLFVSGGADATAIIWTRTEGGRWQASQTLRGHTGAIHELSISPDGQLLATASADETIRLWELPSGAARGVLRGHPEDVLCVAFSSDSQRLISGGSGNAAIVWDLAQATPLTKLIGHSAAINSVAFSPDGRRALTGSQDNTIKLWDTTQNALAMTNNGQEVLSLSAHQREVTSVQFSPSGKQILSTGRDRQALIWDSVPVDPQPLVSTATADPTP